MPSTKPDGRGVGMRRSDGEGEARQTSGVGLVWHPTVRRARKRVHGRHVEDKERAVIVVWMKRWLLMAVAVPLVAWALDQVADRVESSRGESDVTKGMHGVAGRIREWRGGRRGGRGQRARSRTA